MFYFIEVYFLLVFVCLAEILPQKIFLKNLFINKKRFSFRIDQLSKNVSFQIIIQTKFVLIYSVKQMHFELIACYDKKNVWNRSTA